MARVRKATSYWVRSCRVPCVWDSRLGTRLLYLGFACLACGCQRKAETELAEGATATGTATFIGPDTRVHPTGELGRASDYTMSVESVKDCPSEGPFAPKRGNVKLGLEVLLEGTSSREVPANSFYATLEDGAGNTYASTLAGCEPPLPAVRVDNGKKARGYVTFEVPNGAQKLVLRYAPLVIGPGKEELRFAVER